MSFPTFTHQFNSGQYGSATLNASRPKRNCFRTPSYWTAILSGRTTRTRERDRERSESHQAAYDEQDWRTLTLFFIPNTTYPLTWLRSLYHKGFSCGEVELLRQPLVGLSCWSRTIDQYGTVGRMRIDRGNRSTRKETCPSATSSSTNPVWPDLGSSSGRRGGEPTPEVWHSFLLLCYQNTYISCFHFPVFQQLAARITRLVT
jgi:hypothetical protein